MYSSNEIILLDEPTSALDTKTEKIIISNIFKEFKNKTIILITHAKENLKFFNKVYEFKNKTLKNCKKINENFCIYICSWWL